MERTNSRKDLPWVDKYRPKNLDEIIHQDEVIKVMKNTLKTGQLPNLLLYGKSGSGKCLSLNTPVLIFDGSIKMSQDIKEGDNLMGDDNANRKVLSITKGRDTMYKVLQGQGDSYVVNSEHIISLKKGSTKGVGQEICDISIKDYINKPDSWKSLYRGYKSERITCWEKKDVVMDPYKFGIFLGTLDSPTISTIPPELEKYNLDIDAHIPHDYKINDVDTRLQVLAGLFDSTGHFPFKDVYFVRISHKSKKLFDDCVFIARSLGFTVISGNNEDEDSTATIYGHGLDEVPVKVISNVSRCSSGIDLLRYPIKIEKLEEDDYYGFEIDGNKRFLLGDFTVTHNTSSILALAYQLYGPVKFKERVIELNASDERGINIVRNKINLFAKIVVGNADPNYPCPPYKLIILDEADSMTTEAQSALRKIMEDRTTTVRFCFICNYINQIIDPIISRCMKFRFKPIDDDTMFKKLSEIANKEKIIISDDKMYAITEIAKGDARKAITILQNLRYVLKYKQDITLEEVYKIVGHISPSVVKPIWDCCYDKNKFNEIIKRVNDFKLESVPIMAIIERLQDFVIYSNLTDLQKSKICIHIAMTEKCLVDGSNEYIQILNVFSYMHSVINEYSINVPLNIC